MQYKIFGGNLPAVSLLLEPGERVFTQSGGMTYMSDGFSMQTNMRGGIMKSLGRMFVGESIFMASYTATRPASEITFSSSFPGAILPLWLDGREYICQKQSFLCGTEDISLSLEARLSRGGFFEGAGARSSKSFPGGAWPFWNWMAPWWKNSWPREKSSR